jgi:hypothetical protein
MGSTYAFLVEWPRIFAVKTIVLAANLPAAMKWLEEYRARHFKDCYTDIVSIVCVGEVVNS